MTKRHLCSGIAAACTLTLGTGLYAAEGNVRVGDTELKGSIQTDTDRGHIRANATDKEMPVGKVNKASGLIGMDVRNSQNEKLGEIKDLVVDLHSGKIAYAVLSVGGFLGIGDKYVAVPSQAFSVNPDQNGLVLNADKARIQNAPSFAKSSWPDLNSAAWNTESSYWLSDATAQGTAGTIRSGTATERLDSTRYNTDPGHATTDAARHNTEPGRATNTDRDTFRGKIIAINPETKTMTVEGASGTREFKFSDRPTLALKENRSPRLSDLKVGYPVNVGFHEENGTYIAHSVMRTDTPEVK